MTDHEKDLIISAMEAAGYSFDGQRVEDDVGPVDLRIGREDTELGDVGTFVHMLDHLVESSRCAAHLQSHVETFDA